MRPDLELWVGRRRDLDEVDDVGELAAVPDEAEHLPGVGHLGARAVRRQARRRAPRWRAARPRRRRRRSSIRHDSRKSEYTSYSGECSVDERSRNAAQHLELLVDSAALQQVLHRQQHRRQLEVQVAGGRGRARWRRGRSAAARRGGPDATGPGAGRAAPTPPARGRRRGGRSPARRSLSCSLRSVSSVSTSTDTSMLRSHTWWSTTSSGSRAMAVVSTRTSSGSARLAEREADAGDRQHPRLGGLGEQRAGRVPASSAARRAACSERTRSPSWRRAALVEELDERGLGRPAPGRRACRARSAHAAASSYEVRAIASSPGGHAGEQPLARRHEVAGGEEVVGDLGRRDLGPGGGAQGVADPPVEVLAARSR